jgi:6-phosphogluconolactonase
MKINVYTSVDQTIEKMARHFTSIVNTAIGISNQCNIVLSGGSSPKRLYELLASYPYKSEVDWSKIYFFFGDERYVPFNHSDYNGLMVKKALFDPLNISDHQVFYISTVLNPEAAALEYSHRITSHFRNQAIRFDLVLLGLGDNAHTASLFPHTNVLHETDALVSAVYLENSTRITMTVPLINNAYAIAFLVYGKYKAEAVKQVLEGERNGEKFPAQLIQTDEGSIDWFLDEEAASLLSFVH